MILSCSLLDNLCNIWPYTIACSITAMCFEPHEEKDKLKDEQKIAMWL